MDDDNDVEEDSFISDGDMASLPSSISDSSLSDVSISLNNSDLEDSADGGSDDDSDIAVIIILINKDIIFIRILILIQVIVNMKQTIYKITSLMKKFFGILCQFKILHVHHKNQQHHLILIRWE